MNAMTDQVAELVEQVSDGYTDYDRVSVITYEGITYRGRTLKEWEADVRMPELDAMYSVDQLERFNHHYLKITEIVISNIGASKATMDALSMQWKVKKKREIQDIIVRMRNESATRRLPGAGILEDMAEANLSDLYTSYQLSCLFYDFWKNNFDKLKIVDSRLTSMGILKNIEFKMHH